LSGVLSESAHAVAVQDPNYLAHSYEVGSVINKKEFSVTFSSDGHPLKDLEVLLVLRLVPIAARKGWYETEFVGRAAVAETSANVAHMVLYKPFKGQEIQKGDHLVLTGDPLTLDEMDLMRKEVLGVLHRDKELEDLYSGLISFKLGMYNASLSTKSNGDTNAFKNSPSFLLTNFGLRWWFFFNPAIGLNFEYSTGSIPTFGFKRESETSSQTYINPGLLYRGRLFVIPTIYSLTYFINHFQTSNPDDFLISSTYSGVNLGVTFYFPYRTQLVHLGPFKLNFNNFELGGGYAPAVSVADANYVRGANSSASQFSANAGLELNLSFRPWRFTNDLFFIAEGGMQMYNLSFSGNTQGTLPGGAPLPSGNISTETQIWYGIRVKYNIRDVIGEMLYGL
jgi:hypothetical protein